MVCSTSAFGQVIYVCECGACCLGRAASVNGQHRSGDVPRLVAEEEIDGVCNITDIRRAAQRAAPHDLLALLFYKTPGHLSIDKAGGDGVDVYTQRPDLPSEGSGKS